MIIGAKFDRCAERGHDGGPPNRRMPNVFESHSDTSGFHHCDASGHGRVPRETTQRVARGVLPDSAVSPRTRQFDGTIDVVGPDGPVPLLDLFQGRQELLVYKHMWYDDTPHQGQCEGCTMTIWHLPDSVYLNARGVSFAILTTGAWPEVADYVSFMGYTQPWYSVRDIEGPIGGPMGYLTSYLRDGDRTFLTYSSTSRGNERANPALGLLDLTPYGRGEAWEDNPDGWPEGDVSCWYWRTDADGNATWGPTGRPTPQWTRPDATPETTLGRHGTFH
ncbi:DUF899 family protein [Nocardia takedensis]|uniref:DUF899 family protein n=1 Tax=Nocardia takedensis TaxID=259390 RepID=UPI00030C854B